MEKVKMMALEEEERRKKRILEDNAKAEEARQLFFAKQAKEKRLHNLKRNLKKERVLENVKMTQRRKEFRRLQLLKKQQADDDRRRENLRLQAMLKQQRLLNNVEAKYRLNT